MNCQKSQLQLASLRPGEMPGELSAHLSECSRCRRTLEVDQQIWPMLELYEAPRLPASFVARFEQGIAGKDDIVWWRRIATAAARVRPSLYAAASVAAVVLGTLVGGWLGTAGLGAGGAGNRPTSEVADVAEGYAQFFDVAPPGSLTRAYLSLDPGENGP